MDTSFADDGDYTTNDDVKNPSPAPVTADSNDDRVTIRSALSTVVKHFKAGDLKEPLLRARVGQLIQIQCKRDDG